MRDQTSLHFVMVHRTTANRNVDAIESPSECLYEYLAHFSIDEKFSGFRVFQALKMLD
jgi:hypothetical protein